MSPYLHRVNKFDRINGRHTALPGADVTAVSEEQKLIIDAVIKFYGDMSKDEMVERTHLEEPWIAARGSLEPTEKSRNVISQELMKKFYAKAALGDVEQPEIPGLIAAQGAVSATVDDLNAAVDKQIQRWSEALDILSTR